MMIAKKSSQFLLIFSFALFLASAFSFAGLPGSEITLLGNNGYVRSSQVADGEYVVEESGHGY